jgi:SAM-dependent methyltransferase
MSVLVRPRRTRCVDHRATLAREYLRGSGMEIGALARPVAVPHAIVSYFDCLTECEMAEVYPEVSGRIAALDGIEDLEELRGIEEESQDFVIVCHVLEYCGNVLAAFHAMRRVLRTGGVLFLAVADKRQTEDRARPVTPLGHLAADFVHGPTGSWTGHLEEWATFLENSNGEEPQDRLAAAQRHARRIRQHVWTPIAWMELLQHLQPSLAFELETLRMAQKEILTVLRKC